MEKKQIGWINGFKGLASLWVVIVHYLLGFAPFGYVGWNCIPQETEKYAYYFRYFPYSILTNGSYPLYIFFALIAFIPSYFFFKTQKTESIKKQALTRYFRLMPYVLFSCLISFALYRFGLYRNEALGALLGCTWDTHIFDGAVFTLKNLLQESLFGTFLHGTQYVSALWCMDLIFIGSYLSYAILLLFGQTRRRIPVYCVLSALLYMQPAYLSFLAGIIAADCMAAREKSGAVFKHPLAVSLCLVIGGLVIGNIPPVLLPKLIPVEVPYAIGTLLALLGMAEPSALSRALEISPLQKLGKYSFTLIVTHMLIEFSFSAWMFVKLMQSGISFAFSFLLTVLASFPLIALLTFAFEKCTAPVTKKLSALIVKHVL